MKTIPAHILLLAFLLLFCQSLYSQPVNLGDQHPRASDYQQFLDYWKENGLPGAFLLIRDKHGIWAKPSGHANLTQNIPMDSAQHFGVMSITKSWTATAIMLLQQEGLLDVDDLVTKYLPEFKQVPYSDIITIRHLMNHSSGIYEGSGASFMVQTLDYFNHNPAFSMSLEDKLAIMKTKAFFEPGTNWVYAGGYELLSVIIERVTSKKAFEVIREKVFAPLQMRNSHFIGDKIAPTPQGYIDIYGNKQIRQLPYTEHDARKKLANPKYEGGTPMQFAGGGGISTGYDLMRFIEGIMKGSLLQPQTQQDMLVGVNIPPNTYGWEYFDYYACGLGFIKTKYGRAIGHEGGAYGHSAFVFYFPEQDVTIAGYMNVISAEFRNLFHDYNKLAEVIFKEK
jgi:D-alanyl-D-alanine carboxypeptidase